MKKCHEKIHLLIFLSHAIFHWAHAELALYGDRSPYITVVLEITCFLLIS